MKVNFHSTTQYQLIRKIAFTSSRNEKMDLLRHVDPLILKMAYSPNIRFFTTAPDVRGSGMEVFNRFTYRLLKTLSDRTLSGNNAKYVVVNYIKSLEAYSAELFKCILNKDMRAGFSVKMINKVFPGLIEESCVMLAQPMEPHRIKYPIYIGPKVDGNRAYRDARQFFSRSGKEILGYNHILTALEGHGIRVPLDGELKDPKVSFEASSGIVRRKSADKSRFQYWVFDLPLPNMPFHQRYAILNKLSLPSNIIVVRHSLVSDLDQIYKMYNLYLKMGFEGAVLKEKDHLYSAGKSYAWMKMKPEETIDLEVVRLLEGTGKWEGSLGKAVVIYKGRQVRVTPAIPDAQKKAIWRDPNSLVGKIIEVIYQNETAHGSLRSPRFEKIRYDK